VNKYTNIKIDDKVLVRKATILKGKWQKRHFAGVDKAGRPMTWAFGTTSWTNRDKMVWDGCKLAEESK